MKFEKFMFWMNLFNGGLHFFIPMSILGLFISSISDAKFLIFGCHPVFLMGIIATIGVVICIIGKIIVTMIDKRDRKLENG